MKNTALRLCMLLCGLVSSRAFADTLQAPEGGKMVPIGEDRVICGELPEGWQLAKDRHGFQTPRQAGGENREGEVKLASDSAGCAKTASSATLVATDAWPDIDATGIVFFPDEGRLEIRGSHLDGMRVLWNHGGQTTSEPCANPTAVGKGQVCAVPVERKLPLDTVFRWLPGHAKDGTTVTTFDAQARRIDTTTLTLRPSRVVLNQVFATTDTLDVSQGFGSVSLSRPEAVSSVDCGAARCEILDGNIIVRGIPLVSGQITISARLGPRFAISHGDKLENSVQTTLSLLRCPLAVVSGSPLRGMDETEILVRVADRCRAGGKLRWFVGADPVEVLRESSDGDADYVLLRTGPLLGASATVTASRGDSTAGVVAVAMTPTVPARRPQSTLELPGHGPIAFIPTNREAVWSLGGVPNMRVVPLDLPGVYSIHGDKGRILVRGEPNSGGFVSLRFAYRRDDLPKGFADANLAVTSESVQRPLHEASLPIPFLATDKRKQPLAEFLCADSKGATVAIEPAKPARIPFASRETCRVMIHQERLTEEDGQQEIVLEVEVSKTGGGKRSDAGINERMVLRPGGEPRVFFLKGVVEQFDQVTVRLSHVVDETRYVLGPTGKQTPPSAQWSATVEGGRARLYVSLNIPAGLYRMNEPAAALTLNFGVLGRLTWLDRNGKEGLLGLETGVLGASLIPQQYNNNQAFPPTLVTLLGLGLRVEVGQGAAVGVHLWGAYEFRGKYAYTASDGSAVADASHWSILFGPSISIGNVGTNL